MSSEYRFCRDEEDCQRADKLDQPLAAECERIDEQQRIVLHNGDVVGDKRLMRPFGHLASRQLRVDQSLGCQEA